MELHSSGGLSGTEALRARYKARLLRSAHRTPAELEDGSTIAQLHARLAERAETDSDLAYASIRARLRLAEIGTDEHDPQPITDDPRRGVCLVSTPPIRRSTMAPRPWRAWKFFGRRNRSAAAPGLAVPRPRWYPVAALRRTMERSSS